MTFRSELMFAPATPAEALVLTLTVDQLENPMNETIPSLAVSDSAAITDTDERKHTPVVVPEGTHVPELDHQAEIALAEERMASAGLEHQGTFEEVMAGEAAAEAYLKELEAEDSYEMPFFDEYLRGEDQEEAAALNDLVNEGLPIVGAATAEEMADADAMDNWAMIDSTYYSEPVDEAVHAHDF